MNEPGLPGLAGVLWWPHSGGRWLCRSLLKAHSGVHQTILAHPWVFVTTDDVLDSDNTTQVHKTRSLPHLAPHLQALISATEIGRRAGLTEYLKAARLGFSATTSGLDWVVGELCMGTPVPRIPDLQALFESCPDLMLIHLVRNPVGCYPSFASRFELDGDPVKVAGSWVTAMACVRTFFERRPDLSHQHRMIRYEDLVSDPKEVLGEVCGFLGLQRDDSMLEDRDKRWGKSTSPDVTTEDRDAILEVASSEMERYGYR